jgi:hypothetical protein
MEKQISREAAKDREGKCKEGRRTAVQAALPGSQ